MPSFSCAYTASTSLKQPLRSVFPPRTCSRRSRVPVHGSMHRRSTGLQHRDEPSTPSSVTSSSSTVRKSYKQSEHPKDYSSPQKNDLLCSLAIVGAHLSIGATSLMLLEGWSWLDSLYYAVVTATTVGYGDVVPVFPESKLFASLYALTSVILIGGAMGRIVEGCVMEGSRRLVQGVAGNPEGGQQRVQNAYGRMIRAVLVWCVIVLLGALLYRSLLGLSWIDLTYFIIASITTIGWGDLHPVTASGKLFATVWLVIAAGGFVAVLASFAEWRAALNERKLMEEVVGGKMTRRLWNEVDVDNDDKVSEAEFLAGTLVNMGKVSREDVNEILKKFKDLDVDGSRYVDRREIDVAG